MEGAGARRIPTLALPSRPSRLPVPAPPVLEEAFRVRSYEIDPDACLTLPTLCDYLQEAAGNHATALGVATDRLLERGLAWVLARLRLEVERYPRWRETMTVTTWPSAADGLYARRDFLLHDAGGALLGRATSAWFIIDVARRRPVRLPEEVLALPRPERPPALAHEAPALAAPDAPEAERRFTVRRSDLDLNRHVNNVRYVEWALEAVPEALRQPARAETESRRCRRLDVQFKAESVYGDTIVSACETSGTTVRHAVRHAEDGRVLALARTDWG